MKSSFRRCIREYVRDARLTKYSQIAEPSGRCTRSMLWTLFTRVAEAKVDELKADPDGDKAGDADEAADAAETGEGKAGGTPAAEDLLHRQVRNERSRYRQPCSVV